MNIATKILLSFLLLSACTMKSPQQKLAEFISDPKNKITQHITVGDIAVRSKYMPSGLINLLSDSGSGGVENGDGIIYFNVKFDRPKGDRPEKEKMLYLNFDMQQDFTLQVGQQSLVPVICQRIENGVSGSYEYMIAFEDPGDIEQKKDFTLLYTDKIFGIGALSFVYNHSDISRVPKS